MKDQSVIAQSCPICLAVDDPTGMLLVAIQRTTPPDAVAMRFCFRCARAIAYAVVEADLGDEAKEVDGDSLVADDKGAARLVDDRNHNSDPAVARIQALASGEAGSPSETDADDNPQTVHNEE